MVLKFILLAGTATFLWRGATGYTKRSRKSAETDGRPLPYLKEPPSSLFPANSDDNDAIIKLVPAFFGLWAFSYTAISAYDIVAGGGLGDSGGAGFAVVLLLALVGAAAYETFR